MCHKTIVTQHKRAPANVPARIGRYQRELSDRVHAAADEHVRQNGRPVTESTARPGLGVRSYRNPRSSGRRRLRSPAPAQASNHRADGKPEE
jgi:hypothetical protein